jgi:hypothetical protein
MTPSTWGVFHDGVIKRVEGVIPGTVLLSLEIRYLRAMFPGEGTSFKIRLHECTKLKYNEYDEAPTTDLTKIQDREPEVLYVTSERPLVLDCVMGTLELAYTGMSVALDDGTQVSEHELVDACELYWKRWQESTSGDA